MITCPHESQEESFPGISSMELGTPWCHESQRMQAGGWGEDASGLLLGHHWLLSVTSTLLYSYLLSSHLGHVLLIDQFSSFIE